MDKFVPKEEGYYWWNEILPNGEPCDPRIVWFDGEGEAFPSKDVGKPMNFKWMLSNGIFHASPIQPPEEGRG